MYGTVISAQKNDDMPQQQVNHSQVFNNNSSNSTRVKTQGGKKAAQKATTLNPQGTTPVNARKNGGAGKQKNGKNAKNNQRPSPTATSRPSLAYTTVMQNGILVGKNKTKTMTTANLVRPRPTAKLPNTKSNSNSNNNNNDNLNALNPSNLDKYQPSYSNIYEKSSGKAPKQVKEGSYTSAPRIENSGASATQNPSMSKMFERYEKIQEIFPELEPYKEVNNPVFFTVSNGKPSRENSKSFSSFVSSFDPVPQKKNTNDMQEARQRITSNASGGGGGGSGKGTHYKEIFLSLSLSLSLSRKQFLFAF